MDFYATGISLFLIGKNVLVVMITILINKDVFEPTYNDLKIMVYLCLFFCFAYRVIITVFLNSIYMC